MSWTCPQCAQTFATRGQRHSCDRQDVGALLAGEPEALRLCHDVLRVLEGLGEVEAAATKTQVSFRRRTRFAWLWLLGPGKPVLSFGLRRHAASPRIWKAVATRGGRRTHHVRPEGGQPLDAELAGWLREAWEAAA